MQDFGFVFAGFFLDLTGIGRGSLMTPTTMGAGVGAIGVTVLMILDPQLPLSHIVAADIACAVPLTLIAGLGW